MKKHDATAAQAAFNEAVDAALDQAFDDLLLTDVAHWLQKLTAHEGCSADCEATGYYRMKMFEAVAALRAWRKRAPGTHVTDDLDVSVTTFDLDEIDINAN